MKSRKSSLTSSPRFSLPLPLLFPTNLAAQVEDTEVSQRSQSESKENEQLEKHIEMNNALRVFWKSKKRHIKKSTFESVYEKKHKDMPHRIPIRKRFRKKKSTILEDKDYNEQQDEDGTITFPCSVCNQEIAISNNFLHKKQHEALATLGFQWMGRKKPHPVMIAVQRQFIISKMLSSFMFTEAILQNINNSFELLSKKQIPGYHYKIFDSLGKSSIHSQKICHVLIKGVATCGDRNSTWRAEMNDKFTIMNYFGNKPNVCFFGLFDGHHGASAAELASKELPVLLLHQLSKCDPSFEMTPEQQQIINSFRTVFREEYIAIEDLFSSAHKVRKTQKRGHEDMHKAFAKAFWRMDRLLRLGRKEVSRVRWSGCSAVTCILEGSFKNPFVNDNWRGTNFDTRSFSSQMTPQIISGVLHIANAGNVQAVLCRNGKGFCLTKEHTTQNINERRRLLQNGAVISPNMPCGLLEGQIKTTRGLGFHGNLKLKKFIIPAPQTISVPIDDLCQFLILATNGLWEVFDKKEVTALIITMFQMYKETYDSIIEDKSLSKGSLLLSNSDESIIKSESDIHILFQRKPASKECFLPTKKKIPDSKYSQHSFYNPKNEETLQPETINHEPYSEKKLDRPNTVDGAQTNEKEPHAQSFYEGAAEYVSRELVNAALEAGSRDNITVMVIFLNGSEYQLLT